jgi:solute:Na+ symporter, SSS family
MLRPLITCFLGMVVFYYCSKTGHMLASSNLAFSFAVKTFGPVGLRGVIMAGFLAAVMGASSALTNSASTIFTLCIFRRFIRPAASETTTVLVGRWASAAVLVIAALWCPLINKAENIFTYFQTGVTYLATPFISVSLVGIFWKRTNSLAASVGLVGGLAIQISVVFGAKVLFLRGYYGRQIHWLYLAFIAEVLTICLVCGLSLITAPAQSDAVEPFVWKPMWFLHAEGVKKPWYKSLLLWYLVYSAIWYSVYHHFR